MSNSDSNRYTSGCADRHTWIAGTQCFTKNQHILFTFTLQPVFRNMAVSLRVISISVLDHPITTNIMTIHISLTPIHSLSLKYCLPYKSILISSRIFKNDQKNKNDKRKVPPRFELGLQDSESWVLTITPWDHTNGLWKKYILLRPTFQSIPFFFLVSVWWRRNQFLILGHL